MPGEQRLRSVVSLLVVPRATPPEGVVSHVRRGVRETGQLRVRTCRPSLLATLIQVPQSVRTSDADLPCTQVDGDPAHYPTSGCGRENRLRIGTGSYDRHDRGEGASKKSCPFLGFLADHGGNIDGRKASPITSSGGPLFRIRRACRPDHPSRAISTSGSNRTRGRTASMPWPDRTGAGPPASTHTE